MAQDHATVAEEEYLQTIIWLEEAGLLTELEKTTSQVASK